MLNSTSKAVITVDVYDNDLYLSIVLSKDVIDNDLYSGVDKRCVVDSAMGF